MLTYLIEAGVTYRHVNETIMPGEHISSYLRYHNGLVGELRVATLERDGIYKLVNEWNRKNRLQKGNRYYEAI